MLSAHTLFWKLKSEFPQNCKYFFFLKDVQYNIKKKKKIVSDSAVCHAVSFRPFLMAKNIGVNEISVKKYF